MQAVWQDNVDPDSMTYEVRYLKFLLHCLLIPADLRMNEVCFPFILHYIFIFLPSASQLRELGGGGGWRNSRESS